MIDILSINLQRKPKGFLFFDPTRKEFGTSHPHNKKKNAEQTGNLQLFLDLTGNIEVTGKTAALKTGETEGYEESQLTRGSQLTRNGSQQLKPTSQLEPISVGTF